MELEFVDTVYCQDSVFVFLFFLYLLVVESLRVLTIAEIGDIFVSVVCCINSVEYKLVLDSQQRKESEEKQHMLEPMQPFSNHQLH